MSRREIDALLRRLGYSLIRQGGGHLIYAHPDFETPLVLASTPGRGRAQANELASIKRRHPEEFAQRKSDEPRKRKRKRSPSDERRKARRQSEPAPERRESFIGCPKCHHRWLSDIDPWGRLCPNLHCDGEIGRVTA